jgi:hypothetical protein
VGAFEPARAGLVPATSEHRAWPLTRLSWGSYPGPTPPKLLDEDQALLHIFDGFTTVRREPLEIEVKRREPLTTAAAVHPYLASAARVMAHWTGRSSYYGGTFVAAGGAWALIGRQQTGKTSVLCELARQGCLVLSDDVTVLDGMQALVGPRLLAVRDASSARGLGLLPKRDRAEDLRLAHAGPAPSSAPLRGWVFLSRGPQLALARLTAAELLRRIGSWVSLSPGTPTLILDWAALPAWSLVLPEVAISSRAGQCALQTAAATLLKAILDRGRLSTARVRPRPSRQDLTNIDRSKPPVLDGRPSRPTAGI